MPFASSFRDEILQFDKTICSVQGKAMILRRIGPDPHENGATTAALKGCPDIFELENGDFAIIGQDATASILAKLPPGASCGPDERIVVIPRKTLVSAKSDIPENL